MSETWKAFLRERGYQPEAASRSVAAEALRGDVIADASQVAVVEIGGPDAERFLQNQFTNNVAALEANDAQLSGYCNPQGRLLAIFTLARIDDGFVLCCPSEIAPSLVDRLSKYRLRSQVTIEDASETTARLTVSGAKGVAAVSEIATPVGREEIGVARFDGGSAIVYPGEVPRALVFGDADRLAALWQTLTGGALEGCANAWELLQIHAGVPEIYEATQEAFVPQMVNLELTDGVSFTKGCFPGQEIVARLHYRGALKRRMYRAYVETQHPVAPGNALVDGDGRKVGQVVRSATSPEGGREILAVIQIEAAEGSVFVEAPDGPALQFLLLPYSVETE